MLAVGEELKKDVTGGRSVVERDDAVPYGNPGTKRLTCMGGIVVGFEAKMNPRHEAAVHPYMRRSIPSRCTERPKPIPCRYANAFLKKAQSLDKRQT